MTMVVRGGCGGAKHQGAIQMYMRQNIHFDYLRIFPLSRWRHAGEGPGPLIPDRPRPLPQFLASKSLSNYMHGSR